jgi:hypothetical protein
MIIKGACRFAFKLPRVFDFVPSNAQHTSRLCSILDLTDSSDPTGTSLGFLTRYSLGASLAHVMFEIKLTRAFLVAYLLIHISKGPVSSVGFLVCHTDSSIGTHVPCEVNELCSSLYNPVKSDCHSKHSTTQRIEASKRLNAQA